MIGGEKNNSRVFLHKISVSLKTRNKNLWLKPQTLACLGFIQQIPTSNQQSEHTFENQRWNSRNVLPIRFDPLCKLLKSQQETSLRYFLLFLPKPNRLSTIIQTKLQQCKVYIKYTSQVFGMKLEKLLLHSLAINLDNI